MTESDEEQIHVYPLFGHEHELNIACWCEPEPLDLEPLVIVHHAEQ